MVMDGADQLASGINELLVEAFVFSSIILVPSSTLLNIMSLQVEAAPMVVVYVLALSNLR
jgi:hypothetical protein